MNNTPCNPFNVGGYKKLKLINKYILIISILCNLVPKNNYKKHQFCLIGTENMVFIKKTYFM